MDFKAKGQEKYIQQLRSRFGSLDVVELPLFSNEVKGVERLASVAEQLFRDRTRK